MSAPDEVERCRACERVVDPSESRVLGASERELHDACYRDAYDRGRLVDFELVRVSPYSRVVRGYALLRAYGLNNTQVAAALGIAEPTLYRNLNLAREYGELEIGT